MKLHTVTAIAALTLSAFGANPVTIPSREEARSQIAAAIETLDRYQIMHNANPDQPIDWADYIHRAFEQLGKSGSGQHSGTVRLSDHYPVTKTVKQPSHVTLEGSVAVGHHVTGSHGFYAVRPFTGDTVLDAQRPNSRTHYSNFGFGIRRIHVQSLPGIDGIHYRDAQQGQGLEQVAVRGFGAATGVTIGGDTFAVRDLYIDSKTGKEQSGAVKGATGLANDLQLYAVRMENVTVHNCEFGAVLGDVHGLSADLFETETVTWPLNFTYQAKGVRISNLAVRHTNNLAWISKARWPREYSLKLQGISTKPTTILLPDGTTTPARTVHDLKIRGFGTSIAVEP